MLVVRPISENDLDGLYELAAESTFGITTLTKDKKILEKKIRHSVESFSKLGEPPEGQTYLFILEDTENGKIAGTSAIESKVGGFKPFYSFRIETMDLQSKSLSKRKEVRVLHLHRDYNGPSALGTLYLRPDYRRSGVGRFLSLVRFIFMADFQNSFEPDVIAEMRGVIDEKGYSPFWEAVGRHFFEIDFPEADYLTGVDKTFIEELMPPYPIYANLLPQSAQNVIGKTHPNTEPALNILYNEGFTFSHHVDIFEAGPLIHANIHSIRSIRQSQVLSVLDIIENLKLGADAKDYIVSNQNADFKAIKTTLKMEKEGVILSEKDAKALNIKKGQSIRFVTLRA